MFEIGDIVRAAVGAYLDGLKLNPAQRSCLEPLAVPVWHLACPATGNHGALTQLIYSCPDCKSFTGCEFRCVAYSFKKLIHIIALGVDVDPSDATIYTCSDPEKCNEYGGSPRILLCLDRGKLRNSWYRLPSTAKKEEREAVIADYPYSIRCEDGGELFSRIKDENHRFSSYEFNYGKWIPGNAREALKGVMMIDDDLRADCSDADYKARLMALLSGKIESPQIAFIEKRKKEAQNG